MELSQVEERNKNHVSMPRFSSANIISSKSTQRNDSEKEFKIDRVYKLTRILGHGAYGVVGAFRNEKTGEKVAIKKIQKIFTNMLLSRRTLRELKLLRHLGTHENIIGIRGILLPTNPYFEEIYVVQDLMEADLHQIIQSGQELTDAHYQYFTYQILKAVKYIHSCNIIHRDLKPGNLLVNSNCELKICDFGLARGMSQQKHDSSHGFMSEYVATRWYRAPEVMLSHACYNQSMDVWSIGCIFAELIGGKVLFPGKQLLDQMNLILNILGTPSEETISRISSKRSQSYLKSQIVRSRVPFSTLFPKANPLAIDLLSKMLVFDSMHRISIDDALKHPYLANHYKPKDVVVGRLFMDNDFEHAETLEEIRGKIYISYITIHSLFIEHIWKEIKIYHPSFLPALTRSSLVFPLGSNTLSDRSESAQAIYSRLNTSKDSPIIANTRDEDCAKHSSTEDSIDMSHLKVF